MRAVLPLLVLALILPFGGCSDEMLVANGERTSDSIAPVQADVLSDIELSLVETEVAEAAQKGVFRARLSADEEVATPPVESDAHGIATFRLSRDGSALHYRLIVVGLDNLTASHIHLAPAGQNGGVVAFLYNGGLIEGTHSGMLAEGTITAANLLGALAGQPLSALVEALSSGGAYVNVHTQQNPGGEIRGQIH
jgi:hypothetical protein